MRWLIKLLREQVAIEKILTSKQPSVNRLTGSIMPFMLSCTVIPPRDRPWVCNGTCNMNFIPALFVVIHFSSWYFLWCNMYYLSWDTIASLVARLWAGQSGQEQGIYLFTTMSTLTRGPPSFLLNRHHNSFPRVEQPGSEADHSPPSSARIKNGIHVHLCPLQVFMSRSNSTFLFVTCTILWLILIVCVLCIRW